MYCKFIEKIDIIELKEEILNNWSNSFISLKRKILKSQKEADAIFLRYTPNISIEKIHPEFSSLHGHKVLNTGLHVYFPKTFKFVNDIAKINNGYLSRVMLARLKPNSVVYPHNDIGGYYECRDRYHLVIQSNDSLMIIEDNEFIWKEGELWIINNKLVHAARNDKNIDRIHLIFDILPYSNIDFMLELIDKYNLIEYGENPVKGINGTY
jgi:aspartyl/asparaginyl beta-hydroxylase (cupin superfamily)